MSLKVPRLVTRRVKSDATGLVSETAQLPTEEDSGMSVGSPVVYDGTQHIQSSRVSLSLSGGRRSGRRHTTTVADGDERTNHRCPSKTPRQRPDLRYLTLLDSTTPTDSHVLTLENCTNPHELMMLQELSSSRSAECTSTALMFHKAIRQEIEAEPRGSSSVCNHQRTTGGGRTTGGRTTGGTPRAAVHRRLGRSQLITRRSSGHDRSPPDM